MPFPGVSNTFNPLTPVGEGLQNLTRLMFSGPTQADRDKAALNAAHADYYRAQTDATRAKLRADEQARQAMEDAPRQVAGYIFKDQKKADDFLAHVRGDKVDTLGVGQTGGMDGGGGDGPAYTPMRVPMPSGLDPASVEQAAQLLMGVQMAKALPGNDNLGGVAKFLPAALGNMLQNRAVAGNAITPQQAADVARAGAAAEGKPMMHDNGYGVADLYDITGKGQFLNGRGNADVALKGEQKNTEKSKQNENNAQAGAATATRDLRRAQTDDVKNTRELVPAITPEGVPIIGADGKPVLVRRDQQGAILSRSAARVTEQDNKDANRPPNAGRAPQPRKLDGKQAEQLADAVAVTLTSLGVDDIDPATKTAIANEARAAWQRGEGMDFNEVVDAAIKKVAPKGFEKTGVPGFRKSRPVGESSAAPAQAAPPGQRQRIRFDANGNPIP